MGQPQLIRTAYHNVAHGLLCHLQHFTIRSVTIVPDERCLAEVPAESWALDDVAENSRNGCPIQATTCAMGTTMPQLARCSGTRSPPAS